MNNQNQAVKENCEMINNYFKTFDSVGIPNQICEICYKPRNLIICDTCKLYFHKEVSNNLK
jgi:hypothetical protein